MQFDYNTFEFRGEQSQTVSSHELKSFLVTQTQDIFSNVVIPSLELSSAKVDPSEMIHIAETLQKQFMRYTALKCNQIENARSGIIPFDQYNGPDVDKAINTANFDKKTNHVNAGLPLVFTMLTSLLVQEWEGAKHSMPGMFYAHHPSFEKVNFRKLRHENRICGTNIMPPTVKTAMFAAKTVMDYLLSLRHVCKLFKYVIDTHCGFLPVMVMDMCGLIPLPVGLPTFVFEFYNNYAACPAKKDYYYNLFTAFKKYTGEKEVVKAHYYRIKANLLNPKITLVEHVKWYKYDYLSSILQIEQVALYKLLVHFGMGKRGLIVQRPEGPFQMEIYMGNAGPNFSYNYVDLVATMLFHNRNSKFRPYAVYTDKYIPFSDYDDPETENHQVIVDHMYLRDTVMDKKVPEEIENEFMQPVRSLTTKLSFRNIHIKNSNCPKNSYFSFMPKAGNTFEDTFPLLADISEKYVIYPCVLFYFKETLAKIYAILQKKPHPIQRNDFFTPEIESKIEILNKLMLMGLPANKLFIEDPNDFNHEPMDFSYSVEDETTGYTQSYLKNAQFVGAYATVFLRAMHLRFKKE